MKQLPPVDDAVNSQLIIKKLTLTDYYNTRFEIPMLELLEIHLQECYVMLTTKQLPMF